jgi:hypothetical protein
MPFFVCDWCGITYDWDQYDVCPMCGDGERDKQLAKTVRHATQWEQSEGLIVRAVSTMDMDRLLQATYSNPFPHVVGKLQYIKRHSCVAACGRTQQFYVMQYPRDYSVSNSVFGQYGLIDLQPSGESAIFKGQLTEYLDPIPVPLFYEDYTKYNVAELRRAIEFLTTASSATILGLVTGDSQIDCTQYPCMVLALTLSVNSTVIWFWHTTVHLSETGSRVCWSSKKVFLTLRELPGVQMLAARNPDPSAPWKKLGLPEYDSWLSIYSPETPEERRAHAGRCALAAAAALEKENKAAAAAAAVAAHEEKVNIESAEAAARAAQKYAAMPIKWA